MSVSMNNKEKIENCYRQMYLGMVEKDRSVLSEVLDDRGTARSGNAAPRKHPRHAPANPYPDTYDECTDAAKQEQNDNARPEIIGSVDNMEQYDTVFLGFPIWWGDLPMAAYTFLESYDFSGKTIIPFCTHEGSRLSGTVRNKKELNYCG